MKKPIPIKVYRYIITDNESGFQEEVNNVTCVYRDGETVEMFIKGGDTIQYNTQAVTITKA